MALNNETTNQDPNQQDQPTSERPYEALDGEDTTALDPDEVALNEARAAMEAEGAQPGDGDDEGAGEPAGEPPADQIVQTPEPGASQPPAPAEPASGSDTPEGDAAQDPGKQPMVPHARFQEVNTELQRYRDENIYLRGQNEALASRPGPGQGNEGDAPAAPPQPTAAERIKSARDRQLEAATQYDSGTITLAQYEQTRIDADDEVASIRTEEAMAQQADRQDKPARPNEPSLTDEALMKAQSRRFARENPYWQVLSEADAARLEAMAVADRQTAGDPIVYDGSARQTTRLRQTMNDLLMGLGPSWYPDLDTLSVAPTPEPGDAPQPPLSPTAKARAAKMELAAGHPPDTSNLGAAGQHNQVTDAQVEQMSDEEFGALPAATRQRYLE